MVRVVLRCLFRPQERHGRCRWRLLLLEMGEVVNGFPQPSVSRVVMISFGQVMPWFFANRGFIQDGPVVPYVTDIVRFRNAIYDLD